jgi:uncharacterized membrane protein
VSLAISGDSLETTLAKSLGMIWLELMVIAAVTLAASASLSFPVAAVAGLSTAAFGQLSGLAVNLLREAVAIGAASGEAPAHAAGGLDQALRTLAAGLLSLLPDFERTSPGDFLAWGNVIPWSFIAAAVLGLLVLRAVPMALVGALAFSRREVGA